MKLISVLFISFISFISFSQETAYFDRSFSKRSEFKDIKNKRLYFLKDSLIEIEDYKNNKIFRKGKFYGFTNLKNLDAFIRYNSSNQYHKSDSLVTENRYGIIDVYDSNEELSSRDYYKENVTKHIQVWNEEGEPVLIKGTGIYTKYYNKLDEKFFQVFKDSLEVESYYIRNKQNDTIFYKVDTRAYPKEGLRNFYSALANTINYPAFAKSLGVDKKVTIQFTIDQYGKLTEFIPLSLPSHNFENKVIKKLKEMPAWNPAILNGKPVKTRFRIPITFRLN